MNERLSIKAELLKTLINLIDEKEAAVRVAIASAREAMVNDTKSSAGDKHETSRAMMQIEIENNEKQLGNFLNLKSELARIVLNKHHDKVEAGALVYTNQENYFISIGIGKLLCANQTFYAISMSSPLGQVLANKRAGDKVNFLNREIILKDIV